MLAAGQRGIRQTANFYVVMSHVLSPVVIWNLPLPAKPRSDHLMSAAALPACALQLWFEVLDHSLHVHEAGVVRLHGRPQRDHGTCLVAHFQVVGEKLSKGSHPDNKQEQQTKHRPQRAAGSG